MPLLSGRGLRERMGRVESIWKKFVGSLPLLRVPVQAKDVYLDRVLRLHRQAANLRVLFHAMKAS